MQEFDCDNNQISKIENLPNGLQTFYCDNNQIRKIENLPNGLQTFYCDNNQISKIENLPQNLQTFDCNNNQITTIRNLPNGLKSFYSIGNPIAFVDNIPIDWFYKGQRGGFRLKWYNIIKHLQRRQRLRFKRKTNAIKIIQNSCHNWLWKPICKDGLLGINCKLGLTACVEIFF